MGRLHAALSGRAISDLKPPINIGIIEVFKKLETSLTPRQIVEIIYAKYPESLWPAAERIIILHLKKLENEGMVKRLSPDLKGKWTLSNSKI